MGISREQALDCFASDDLIGIGMEADAVRRRLHPEGIVTYLIDRTVRFTSSRLDRDALFAQVRHTVDCGGTGIHLQGPHVSLDVLEDLLADLRQHFPSLWLHGLSASQILAASFGLPLEDVLLRLRAAGLNSLAGDDAGLLHDDVRLRLDPQLCSSADWIAVHRTAHRVGLPSSASLSFGAGELPEHRVAHLEHLHRLQGETGGFLSFVPSTAQPGSARPRTLDEATAVEYLQTLAISRMFLDNIENVESDWPSQGLKVLQMGLRFGANDVGSIAIDQPASGANEEELRRLVRDAGFKPMQRDTPYRTLFLN